MTLDSDGDETCCKWCLRGSDVLDDGHEDRISEKEKLEAEKCNWTGIEFVEGMKHIDIYEKENPVSVAVHGFDAKYDVYPSQSLKVERRSIRQLMM